MKYKIRPKEGDELVVEKSSMLEAIAAAPIGVESLIYDEQDNLVCKVAAKPEGLDRRDDGGGWRY